MFHYVCFVVFILFYCYRFQKYVHINQKVDYPSSGLMSAQAFENLVRKQCD